MSENDYLNSILRDHEKDLEDIEEETLAKCDYCLETCDSYVVHKDYVICDDCINIASEYSDTSLNDIVNQIIKNKADVNSRMFKNKFQRYR